MNPSSLPPISRPDITLTLKTSPTSGTQKPFRPEERAVRLIHLLVSCAKHASSGNLHRADSYLRQISELASVSGDPVQRLSARFASALAVRLVKRWPGLYKALNFTKPDIGPARPVTDPNFPFPGFAHSIIARTLVRTTSMEQAVHLIYFGPSDPKSWSAVLRGFAQLGRPAYLKVTCVCSKKSFLKELGHGLTKEAESMDLTFQFNPVNAHLRDLTIEMINPSPGETLAIVSMLGLHKLLAEDDRVDAHFSNNKGNISSFKESKKMVEFLGMLRSMSPKVFFLVEQEADHNTNRLVDRFVEGLHYYSAVFDSIESSYGALTSGDRDRFMLEEGLGKEIENIVSSEGLEREERHERYAKWMVRFGRAGFRPVRMWMDWNSNDAHDKDGFGARVAGGYKVVTERTCTMICWHDRPLYAISAWTC